MVRDVRVKEYTFPLGSLSASAGGLLETYSDHVINGTIQSIALFANSYTSTGSLMLFASGLLNSGTNLGDIIVTLRAGSANQVYYPFVYGANSNGTFASGTTGPVFFQNVMNSRLRLVGSALGNATSGLSLSVRYI